MCAKIHVIQTAFTYSSAALQPIRINGTYVTAELITHAHKNGLKYWDTMFVFEQINSHTSQAKNFVKALYHKVYNSIVYTIIYGIQENRSCAVTRTTLTYSTSVHFSQK